MMWNVVLLGLVNWMATTIIVESELTRPVREWITARKYAPTSEIETNNGPSIRHTFWRKTSYLVGCHLCTGTWVGLAEAAVLGTPLRGFTGWVAGGLMYKAIGHLTLELRPQAWIGRAR